MKSLNSLKYLEEVTKKIIFKKYIKKTKNYQLLIKKNYINQIKIII
jgi:hypothetical protein